MSDNKSTNRVLFLLTVAVLASLGVGGLNLYLMQTKDRERTPLPEPSIAKEGGRQSVSGCC